MTNVMPEIDSGRFPAKGVHGDRFAVSCDILSDGHDRLAAALRYRGPGDCEWREAELHAQGNDRYEGSFDLAEKGEYLYDIVAWRDLIGTWAADLATKEGAGQDIALEIEIGACLLRRAIASISASQRVSFVSLLADLEGARTPAQGAALVKDARETLRAYRPFETFYGKHLRVVCERPRAAFSAWYELTPRSQSDEVARHGSFADVIERLPYARDMGFESSISRQSIQSERHIEKAGTIVSSPTRRTRKPLRDRLCCRRTRCDTPRTRGFR